MANKIVLKKSSVAAKVPLAGDLDVGEIAINLADQKLYSKNAGGTVILVGSGAGGAGDVSGPASATDNALARFDGTTGKLIKNSAVTLDDNGNILSANSLGFDTTPGTLPTSAGTMSWDDGEGVPSVILKGGNTTLQVGAQEYARVYNDSGATLNRGQVVYIFGAQGNRISVKLAKADVEATSFGTIGLVAESIASGAEGFVIVSGALYKLNTTGLTAGSTVYLSPTTAGAITTTKPQAPQQLVVLGWVERVDNIVGSIYVKIDNGYELEELHDVQVTSPASGNILIYDASTTPIGVWKNANLTAGTGVSVTNGAGSITVANTGVLSLTGTADEVDVSASTGSITLSLPATINANTTGNAANVTGIVAVANGGSGTATPSLVAGTNVTITGSWPNQTIAATGGGGGGSGTVTDVSVVSANGFAGTVATSTTTPAITLTTSITGVLKGNGTAISAAIAGTDYVTPTGTETLTNKTASGLTLNDGYTEEVFAVTGTAPALSPTNGSIQTWTLTGNSTPTSGTWASGQSITLMIDDGNAYTVTWTSLAVTWETVNNAAPSLVTTGYTVIVLWKVGSTIYGALVGG